MIFDFNHIRFFAQTKAPRKNSGGFTLQLLTPEQASQGEARGSLLGYLLTISEAMLDDGNPETR